MAASVAGAGENPSPGSHITPMLNDVDRKFLAGTMGAEEFYRVTYAEAVESAKRTIRGKHPVDSGSNQPAWLPPLSRDGEKFLQGYLPADVYIERAHDLAERRAQEEIDHSSRALYSVSYLAGIASLVAIVAIGGRILTASVPTVLFAIAIIVVLVALALLVGRAVYFMMAKDDQRWMRVRR